MKNNTFRGLFAHFPNDPRLYNINIEKRDEITTQCQFTGTGAETENNTKLRQFDNVQYCFHVNDHRYGKYKLIKQEKYISYRIIHKKMRN